MELINDIEMNQDNINQEMTILVKDHHNNNKAHDDSYFKYFQIKLDEEKYIYYKILYAN
jgi:hypothetical protein